MKNGSDSAITVTRFKLTQLPEGVVVVGYPVFSVRETQGYEYAWRPDSGPGPDLRKISNLAGDTQRREARTVEPVLRHGTREDRRSSPGSSERMSVHISDDENPNARLQGGHSTTHHGQSGATRLSVYP